MNTTELTVPMTAGRLARVPFPMTEEEFDLLTGTLQLWKTKLLQPPVAAHRTYRPRLVISRAENPALALTPIPSDGSVSEMSKQAMQSGDGRSVRGRIRALERKLDSTVEQAESLPAGDGLRATLAGHAEGLRQEIEILEKFAIERKSFATH